MKSLPLFTSHTTVLSGCLFLAMYLLAVEAQAANPAADEASANAYDDGWQAGDNGGFGFGAWLFSATGTNAGQFTASSTGNGDGDTAAPSGDIDTEGRSWGLFANLGDTAEAVRPFSGTLDIGQSLLIALDTGFIDSGTVGIALQNSSSDNRLEFFFVGGQTNYTIQLGDTAIDTGIAFTDEGLEIVFTLTDTNTAALAIMPLGGAPQFFTNLALSGTADSGVDRVRVFNSNAGALNSHDSFVNRLRITGASTIVVNTNDDGPGSLRAAIDAANANSGADVILFAIPPFNGSVKTIAISNALPEITDPVEIDGYSQPGASRNTLPNGINAALKIELDGSLAGTSSGLVLITSNSLVRGLVIHGFTSPGIYLHLGGGNHRVQGNFLGPDATGTNAIGNNYGVSIEESPNNLIGGTSPDARNLISGNRSDGVNLQVGFAEQPFHSNRVLGNFIGTDVTGMQALGNFQGITVSGVTNTLIGGTAPGARNLISGNFGSGVYLFGAQNTTVQGNFIGTDVTGAAGLGNGSQVTLGHGGVIVQGPNNLIGGTDPGAGNVISANRSHGVEILEGVTNNSVQGNLIGTDASGIARLGNAGAGIIITGSSTKNVVGAEEGNIIAFNESGGVVVELGLDNLISRNSIFSNNGLGIDLGADGLTSNDPGDGDNGPNNLQNFPVITNVTVSLAGTGIQGTLNSATVTQYRIEFFSMVECDPSGNGEGDFFLGATNVTTDVSGDAAFSLVLPFSVPSGRAVSATATDPDGNTSEFAKCIPITFFPPGDVNGDAHVTGADSLLINQVLVGLRSNTHPVFAAAGFANGDVNTNNVVNGADSLLINQVIVGLRSYATTKILPGSRESIEPTPVTIFGIGFPTNIVPTVTIGDPVNVALTDVVVVSREQITAIVPPGGGLGTGTVNVVSSPTNGVISFGRFINE